LETTFGETLAPFGLDRMKMLEWISALISLKEESVSVKLSEAEIPKLLLLLARKYDMNSILHLKISQIFTEAINVDVPSYTEAVSKAM
jgi:hypothetical protein